MPTLPISSHVNQLKNHHFVPHFQALPLQLEILPGLLTLDLCSTRPELLENQELKLRALLCRNGDTLKSAKNSRFVQSDPFSQIQSPMSKPDTS